MKLIVEAHRDELLKPLQAVAGIVERRQTLPILSNVLIERRGAALFLTATDLEIQIRASFDCGGDTGDSQFTVSARKLVDILRALAEATPIRMNITDSRLHLQAGSSRFVLHTLSAEEFPRLPELAPDAPTLRVAQGVLKRLLGKVQFAMAQQDVRYYLNGLLIVVEGSSLLAVATDGHRLALAKSEVEGGHARQEVILPRKTVLELMRLLEDGEQPLEFRFGGNQVAFSAGGRLILSKLVDGKFPDYQRVIPKEQPKRFPLARALIQQALQRVGVLANDKLRGVRWIITPDNLRIVCNNAEQEEAQEELAIAYQGDPLDIGFNISYLLDVFSNVPASEFTCEFGDASSSALITLPQDPDFRYVVMPMRI
ncbi:MAG TPA: DNA polymerase III subunit beta [Burkholderiales bacterium]|nr:DNA polymerase III subunit beta [Burkholderiales bacterium]